VFRNNATARPRGKIAVCRYKDGFFRKDTIIRRSHGV
jgi:hypothetical protein